MLARTSSKSFWAPISLSQPRRYGRKARILPEVPPKPGSPNEVLLKVLYTDLDIVRSKKSEISFSSLREKSFQKAIEAVSALDYELISCDAVKNIPDIGSGTQGQIKKYLRKCLNHDNNIDESLKKQYVMELESIPGIGKTKAESLVRLGCQGRASLKEKAFWTLLSKNQQMSVSFVDHMEQPVTRQQCETIAEFIRSNLSSRHEVYIVGNHRRGAPEARQAEFAVFHPDHVHVSVPPTPLQGAIAPRERVFSTTPSLLQTTPLHKEIVPTLIDRGLLMPHGTYGYRYYNTMAIIPEKDENGQWKTRRERLDAIKEVVGEFRRIRINMMPMKSKGAALIYMTGDGSLKSQLRRKAQKIGLYIDDLGLWKWHTDEEYTESKPCDEDANSSGFWQLLPSATEESIFEQLGMKYIEPERRTMGKLRL